MDAASNNSVDDIRDLRERVAYAPVAGGYKVYILDEAHMLTPAAWNAFLKTLEEPPPHTIFVLATTEANKVLPTVVDRCHRFDFGRPCVPQIASVLRRAADSESIEIPDEAVALVARSATGSFRDALGTLEQLVAYSGTAIVIDDVLAVLGAADADLLFGTIDAVSAGDARSALLAAARLADSGRDLGRFFGDLEAHARGLMVTQVLGDVPPELRVTPEQDERLAEQARRVGGAELVRLLELIAVALRAMKDGADAAHPARARAGQGRQAGARADRQGPAGAHRPAGGQRPVRPARAAAGRRRAAAAAPPRRPRRAGAHAGAGRDARGPRRHAAAGRLAGPAPRRAGPRRRVAGAAAPATPRPPARPPTPPRRLPDAGPGRLRRRTPRPERPRRPRPPSPPRLRRARAREHGRRHHRAGRGAAARRGRHHAARRRARQRRRGAARRRPGRRGGRAGARDRGRSDARGHRGRGRRPGRPAPAPTSRPAWSSRWTRSAACGRRSWSRCARSTPMLAALLEDCAPASLAGDGLTLAWPESSAFLKRKAEDPANRELLAKAIRAVTGSSLRLAYELRAEGDPLPRRGRRRGAEAVRRGSRAAIHGRVRRGGAASGTRGADLMPQPPNLQKMLAEAQAMLAAAAGGAGEAQGAEGRGVRRRRHGQGRDDRRHAPARASRSTPTRSIPRTSRCCRTWSSPRSTRRCARPRSSSRASSAAPSRAASTR